MANDAGYLNESAYNSDIGTINSSLTKVSGLVEELINAQIKMNDNFNGDAASVPVDSYEKLKSAIAQLEGALTTISVVFGTHRDEGDTNYNVTRA